MAIDLGIDFDRLTSELGNDLGDVFGKVAGQARGGLGRIADIAQNTGTGLERIVGGGGGVNPLGRIAALGGGGGSGLGDIAGYGGGGGSGLDFFDTLGGSDPFAKFEQAQLLSPLTVKEEPPQTPASYPTGGAGVGATGADPNTDKWRDLIDEAGAANGVDGDIIQAVMMIESGGNAGAVSAAGAQGLMQVMPFHFQPGEDGMDPRTNVMKGAKVLSDNYKRWGDWNKAVAAYLGAIDGSGNILGGDPYTGVSGNEYVRRFNENLSRIKAARQQQPTRPNGQAVDPNGYSFPVVDYQGSIQLHWGEDQGAADIFAAAGTAIVAMRGGKVTSAGYSDIGGYNMTIQGDDGLTYYYAHMQNQPAVSAGQTVAAGVFIGQVGDTGNAKGTGAHLHIGIGHGIQSGTGPRGGSGANYNATALLQQVYQNQYAR